MDKLVTIAGLIIIVLSFVHILRNPSQTLMDSLLKKRKEEYDQKRMEAQLDISQNLDQAEPAQLDQTEHKDEA